MCIHVYIFLYMKRASHLCNSNIVHVCIKFTHVLHVYKCTQSAYAHKIHTRVTCV